MTTRILRAQIAIAAKAVAEDANLKTLMTAEEVFQAMKAAGTFGSVSLGYSFADSAPFSLYGADHRNVPMQDVLEALYSASLEFSTPLSVNPAADSDDNDEAPEEADEDEDE